MIQGAVAAVAFAAGFAAGYGWEHRARVAEVAEIRADHARQAQQAAQEAAERLRKAQAVAQAIIDERANQMRALQRSLSDAERQIKTVGRRCLDGDAVRVLNRAIVAADGVPNAPGGAADTDAAAATDTDVARWVVRAVEQYESCRQRIDALRAWRDAMGQ